MRDVGFHCMILDYDFKLQWNFRILLKLYRWMQFIEEEIWKNIGSCCKNIGQDTILEYKLGIPLETCKKRIKGKVEKDEMIGGVR